MDKEITGKLQEILQKCQAWVDDEKYIPKKFRAKSWSDEFAEKIVRELEDEMIKQKFGLQNDKIYLPTKYFIRISSEDSSEFSGIKRELLIQELNKFVERCLRMLGIEYHDQNFVQIYASTDLQHGEIKVIHQWDESYSPSIWFNDEQPAAKFDDYEEDLSEENTIIVPRRWENNSRETETDCETVVRKRSPKFYSLDIWRDGTRQNNLPIFQSEVTLGRGSPLIEVDVALKGDLAISRRHAILTYRENNSFNLSVTGQNPIFIGDKTLFTGETTSFNQDETVQIGSYVLKMQK